MRAPSQRPVSTRRPAVRTVSRMDENQDTLLGEEPSSFEALPASLANPDRTRV